VPAKAAQRRYLCSELVEVQWVDEFGQRQELTANLEEIWSRGAQLLMELPVRPGTRLGFKTRGPFFEGRAIRCDADPLGYFVTVAFNRDIRWSPELYRPAHLLDPSKVKPQPGRKTALAARNALELAQLARVVRSQREDD